MRLDKITIVWTVVVLAVTAGFLSLVTRPQLKRLSELGDQIQAKRTEQALGRQDVKAIEAMQQEADELMASATDFDGRIPKQESLGVFLEDLARLTEAHKLRPETIEPGKPVRSSKVVALPITFRIRGPFPAIHGLIQDIERMPRLTQVERFETETDPETPEIASAEVSLRIFFQAS